MIVALPRYDSSMKHVVVVGGGISGLSTAYRVAGEAARCGLAIRTTVLESAARPGGRVWTEHADGFQIEFGASSFPGWKKSTLELCQAIGLGSELIAARPEAKRRFIRSRNRLHCVPTDSLSLVQQFLRSDLLSWSGKFRLLREFAMRPRHNTRDESVHEFACRRVGREAAEILVDAIVTGIHAGDPTLLSVAAAFPRMTALERQYGSLIRAGLIRAVSSVRTSAPGVAATAEDSPSDTHNARSVDASRGTLWSLKRGMGQIVERLAAEPCLDFVRGVAVRRIESRADGRWTVQADGRDAWQADAVVLACPSFAQAEIIESHDDNLARLLREIRYNSVTVVALGFRKSHVGRSVDGFGYLVPQRWRRDVLGVLWSSSIFDGRAPNDMVLMQAMCGGWNRPDIVAWDDDRLVRAVLHEIHQTMNLRAPPCFVQIVRWPQAIPQYHLGHLDRVNAIESRRRQWRGLFLTGNSFRGIGVNDCTEEAVRCAQEVVNDLRRFQADSTVDDGA